MNAEVLEVLKCHRQFTVVLAGVVQMLELYSGKDTVA
jgi:hypothetical protein